MTTERERRMTIQATALGPDYRLERGESSQRAPAAGEVLIGNAATGLNHIDLLASRAEMPPGLQPQEPFVAGVEGAGVVQSVGSDVSDVQPGDRVMWFGDLGVGGLSSSVLVESHQVVAIDDSIDIEQAAALPVAYTTALHMLGNLAEVPENGWVFVHAGGGGVGLALVELATALGLQVIATDVSDKRDAITAAGAEVFVDHRTEDLAEAVRSATAGRGLSLSLNAVGGQSLARDFDLLAPFGTVILYGFLSGLPETTIAETMVPFFDKSIALRVSDIYTLSRANPALFKKTLARVARYASDGQVRPRVRRFDDAREAFAAMEAKTHIGKLVIGTSAWQT